MMESLVVSLKLAKRLDEAGWPTDPEFCWVSYAEGGVWRDEMTQHWQVETYNGQPDVLRAPTAQEIAHELHGQVFYELRPQSKGYMVSYIPETKELYIYGETISDALALLWLQLKELYS